MLVIIYHVLVCKEGYNELGSNYFDKRNVEVQRNRLVRQSGKPLDEGHSRSLTGGSLTQGIFIRVNME
jgi:hypothetical protein